MVNVAAFIHCEHGASKLSVGWKTSPGEPYLTIGFDGNVSIFLTPNQALALRDAIANNPELCAYETECQREASDECTCVRTGDSEDASGCEVHGQY